MKILKNAGSFTVLSKTEDVIHSIASAARTCYQSQEFASEENDEKLVRNLIKREHYAMLEFADMTVRFDNCSRGFTHELVRHRLCSFAQESTRYVDESDFEMIVPPHRDDKEMCITVVTGKGESITNIQGWLEVTEEAYKCLRKAGWKPEDARQVLPTAIAAQIVVKCNLREWIKIFELRTSQAAHWEIRAVMINLLKWCKINIPIIFDDFYIYTVDDKEYAHKIMSKYRLSEEIKFYNLSHEEQLHV
jgi:thymidylate synthase (FAD)